MPITKSFSHTKYLWIILCIAALFRLPFLATNPIGVHADEASTGYDAYSIWQTGKDQHGVYWPLFAQSFGEYNEALHRYLVAPSIAIFGLNAFAIRLPNALLGILTVWVLYHLTRSFSQNITLACLASLFLAISPWHIQFSRWSARAILMPLLFCFALWLFLKGKERPRNWILSALFFGLGLYTYSAARVFIPLFLLGLVIIYWPTLKLQKTAFCISASLFLLIFIKLFLFWITPEGSNRAQELLNPDPIALIFNYISYFMPNYLFINGDANLRHSIPDMGQLYHFELLLIPLGLWHVWHQKDKTRSLLFLWLFLYPIPAAFTGEPHAIRSLMGAPLFAILSAYGAYTIYEKRHRMKHHQVITSCAILLITFNIGIYLKRYYVNYPQSSAWWWEYGLKETIAYTEKQPHLAIQHTHGFYTPFYIHVLFHTQFPPSEYQKLPKGLRENYWVNAPLKNKYYNLNIMQLYFAPGDTALLIMRPEDVTILNQTHYAWQKVHHIEDPSGQEVITLIKANAKQ